MFIRRLLDYSKIFDDVSFSIINHVCDGVSLRITESLSYEGHNLYFLDLSTLTKTGTFKDIVGGYIISYCIQNKISLFVTQSSGNTANAIAYYASKHGIRVVILYPKLSRYKINSVDYSTKYVTFIEVDKSEQEIKELTQSISEYRNIPWLPSMKHQVESNRIRAYFIDEFTKHYKLVFDYTSQALSSGFGIFGLYDGFSKIKNRNYVLPKLIGVQQECIKPFKIYVYKEEERDDTLIEPTLFRSKPTPGMLNEMRQIVSDSQGFIVSISFDTYKTHESQVINLLKSKNIDISVINDQVIEKSGIISTIGVLQAIENKQLAPNSNILISITGGYAKGIRGLFVPNYIINQDDTFEQVKQIVDNINI